MYKGHIIKELLIKDMNDTTDELKDRLLAEKEVSMIHITASCFWSQMVGARICIRDQLRIIAAVQHNLLREIK